MGWGGAGQVGMGTDQVERGHVWLVERTEHTEQPERQSQVNIKAVGGWGWEAREDQVGRQKRAVKHRASLW